MGNLRKVLVGGAIVMTVFACTTLMLFNAGPAVELTVDTTQQKPISPYIYGVNYPDWDHLGKGYPLARQGGNRLSAYNWETNASNAGSDYHHQNDGYLGESNEAGWTARTFMEAAQAHDAAVLLTVPTTGYVSADKNGDGDVNKTPDYINVRFHKSYPKKGSKFVYPPNTKDKAVYQDEFVSWITKIKNKKTPVWFSLDNEPDLWGSTHARIWPVPPTYSQIVENNTDYAAAIKAVDPKTLIFGPASYGWNGYRTFQNAPDGNGRDFLEFYLASMKEAEKKAGKRLLDVLDLHWYPEAKGEGVRICEGTDKPGTPAARIQAPRSLWDPTYVEDSWISDSMNKKPIELVPRTLREINKNYPGTKLAFTEYNYGGGAVISGAIAQADVLGIFGRYGVFAACNWGISPKDTAQIAGLASFLDYDGKRSKFADLGLEVKGETPASNSLYAALDSKDKGRLTLVYINKTAANSHVVTRLKGFKGTAIKAYTISSKGFTKPTPLDAKVSNENVNFEAPALSVTTIEVRK